MKTRIYINKKMTFFLGAMMLLILGCERDISDDAVVAGFSTLGDVYTDGPIGLGTDFYFPYGDSNS